MKENISNIQIKVKKQSPVSVLKAQTGESDFSDYAVTIPPFNDAAVLTDKVVDIAFTYDGNRFIMTNMSLHSSDNKSLCFKPSSSSDGRTLFTEEQMASLDEKPAETTLDLVIAPVSWQETFHMGTGVDAITGTAKGTAVADFKKELVPGKNTAEKYVFIENKEDHERLIQASLSGKYNIDGIVISGSSSFLQEIKYSATSVTLVADYSSNNDNYEKAPSPHDYQLTATAKSVMEKSPQQFRDAYGDYFVAGTKSACRFIATYICTSSSVEELIDFKASFGVQAPGVFDIDASAAFKEAAKKFNISVEVNVYMYGCNGSYKKPGAWTMEAVIKALEWFKDNESPKPVSVELKHYTTIEPLYPHTINIDPSVFVELSFLYQKTWVISAQYKSCPSIYTKPIEYQYNDFIKGIAAEQKNLVTNEARRRHYHDDALYLSFELENILARKDFYFKMKQQIEIGKSNHQSAQNGISSWDYGITSNANSAINLESVTLPFNKGAGWPHEKRSSTISFSSAEINKPWLIVGWRVIDNWKDGTNGGWHKTSEQIIGNASGSVYVESQRGRGCDWSVQVFYVMASDYQF